MEFCIRNNILKFVVGLFFERKVQKKQPLADGTLYAYKRPQCSACWIKIKKIPAVVAVLFVWAIIPAHVITSRVNIRGTSYRKLQNGRVCLFWSHVQ